MSEYPYGGITPPAPPTAPPAPQPGSFAMPYAQPQLAVPVKPTYPDRGKAVASMVLGIVAWGVALLLPIVGGFFAFILACVGLPLGIVAMRSTRRNQSPRGAAKAGFILNLTGLELAVLVVVLWFAAIAAGTTSS